MVSKQIKAYRFKFFAFSLELESVISAPSFALQTHCICLRLVTGRKGLAVSLAGPLSRAKLVTCWRYEHKGCEEWERHADKMQRGEIKLRNVTLLTELFPLGIGMGCDLFHGQWRHGSTPFNPLTESILLRVTFWTDWHIFMSFLCFLLGVGAGGAGEVEVEHGLRYPQWFYRAHHAQAAYSQRQVSVGPKAHADFYRSLCYR